MKGFHHHRLSTFAYIYVHKQNALNVEVMCAEYKNRPPVDGETTDANVLLVTSCRFDKSFHQLHVLLKVPGEVRSQNLQSQVSFPEKDKRTP